jgi:transposase
MPHKFTQSMLQEKWRPAMEYIGLDLGKTSSQVCIQTEDGELLERRIKTERECLSKLLGERPPARILIEASTESEWVARHLEGLGHEVVVADPNFAPMYATRNKKIKTDKRDARTLCEACRIGAYRPAHRTSDKQRHIRAQLAVRETMVRTRAKYISLIGAIVRREGWRIPPGSSSAFLNRVKALELPKHLRTEIMPLLALMKTLNEQIKRADGQLEKIVKDDAVVKRLATVPGIGPVTATAFAATIDEASRFSGAKQVRSYLGLVPRELSSGEKQRRGHISKAGNKRARYLLIEAAWALLHIKRGAGSDALRGWATRIAGRRGKRVAAVALARKLTGILYAIWRDGAVYDPQLLQPGCSRAELAA